MRIVGVQDPDADRPAKDVAAERGSPWNPFQGPRSGETWSEYCVRTGETRRESARAWWGLTQDMDAARGLPRSLEPTWSIPATLDAWDDVPWLTDNERMTLRSGALPVGPLNMRLEPWNRFEAAVQPLIAPEATSIAELVERQSRFERVLAVTSPQIVSGGGGVGLRPETVGKWLRKGGSLVLDGATVAVRLGPKVIPVLRAANTAYEVAKFIDAVTPHVDAKQRPTREYQPGSGTWIFRWPDGTVTAAPPPG